MSPETPPLHPAVPPPPSRRLLALIRSHLTLSRAQALMGIVAATLSIGGSLYAYLYQHTKSVIPTTGEVLAVVQDARSGGPVVDAIVEVLTGKDAVVTTLASKAEGRAQGSFPEGTYRLRVTHPRFAVETRQVHVIAGHTAEIHVRLAARGAAARSAGTGSGPPSGPGRPAGEPSPVEEVERGVKKGVETLRRIFK